MKKVIVVLSAGRSGTSLLMNVLGTFGMSLSENILPATLGNPEGYFEDTDIVQIHNELLLELRAEPTIPLPDDWLDSRAAPKAREKLRALITERLENATTIWGFKDPRICSFLPLWIRIFNTAKVVPVFILAVRNPTTVASSLRRQINRDELITELQWLQRNCDAIYHTAADCFIAHYEEWFADPGGLVRGLLHYTGLSEFSGRIDLDAGIEGLVKPNLNRAQYEEYSVQNQWVAKLYAQLQQCHGSNFDHKALMDVVKECRKIMKQFSGWANVASKGGELRAKLNGLEAERKKELKKAVSENNDLLQQVKDLFEEVSNLRRQIASVSSSNRPAEITGEKTIPRNTSLPQREGLILLAKRRVANLLPGIYRYYRGKCGALRAKETTER